MNKSRSPRNAFGISQNRQARQSGAIDSGSALSSGAEAVPDKIRAALASLSEADAEALRFDWSWWARENQFAPEGAWVNWVILAGRGFGKTRIGAEMVRRWVRKFPLVNLIGATAADARDIMIEGESGILALCPRQERPLYVPSKRRLEWPNLEPGR